MGLFGNTTWTNSNGGSSGPRQGGGFGRFLQDISPAIPIVGGIASNIIAGINERKARLYNTPANQVKRLQEAGLPLAAGSNITAGGGVSTKVSDLGTGQATQNLGASITRSIDRKKLEIMQQELRQARTAADLAAGEAKNKLNPTGSFEPTNQGANMMNEMVSAAEAAKAAKTVNKWMDIEKAQNVLRSQKETAKIAADTAISLVKNGILLSDAKIKAILAQWQGKMSSAEFTNLIRRNTGLKNANEISAIQGEILRMTKMAQVTSAINHAAISGQNVESNQLGLVLKNLETESAKSYYKVRASADASYRGNEWDRFTPADLMYLQLFTPRESSLNLGTMSNIFK